MQKSEPVSEFLVVDDEDAADNVGMTAKIFRRRMHDNIGAVIERTLAIGRGEGVVAADRDAMLLCDLGDGGDVDDLEQRVCRRFQPDEFCFRLDGGFKFRRVGQIDIVKRKIRRVAAHTLEQAERSAINIVHGDDIASRRKEFEHGRNRRHTRGESKSARTVFQIGDAALIGEARRVGAARINKTLVNAGALLRIGRRLVDRLHNGASGRVMLLAGVDDAGRESGAVFLVVGHEGQAFVVFAKGLPRRRTKLQRPRRRQARAPQ